VCAYPRFRVLTQEEIEMPRDQVAEEQEQQRDLENNPEAHQMPDRSGRSADRPVPPADRKHEQPETEPGPEEVR
jgi:hypothetical protein